MSESKGRRTRTRGEVKVARAVAANSMTEWLNDRWEAARKRNAAPGHARPSGSGVTLEMRSLSHEVARREPEWVVKHEYPTTAMRSPGGMPLPKNVPYVNPARDFRRGRRLRAELRVEVQS